MLVKDLKKLLEGVDGELNVELKVQGFNFKVVETGKVSFIRRALILE